MDDVRNVIQERLGRPEQGHEVGRGDLLAEAENLVADDLEREADAVLEQPLHHAGIDKVVRELLVGGLHVVRLVERLGFELDVMKGQRPRQSCQDVLVRDDQANAGRVDRH